MAFVELVIFDAKTECLHFSNVYESIVLELYILA